MSDGGRLNLRLESSEGSQARFSAELSDGREAWQGAVEVDAEGSVRFAPWRPAEPPAWLCQATSAIVRAAWRSRNSAEATPWPRRITRWRLAPAQYRVP